MKVEKSAVILAAGVGSKMFPYTSVRSKTTIKIAEIPLIRYNIEALTALDCPDIVVVTLDKYQRELELSLSDLANINVVCADGNQGSADSLLVGAKLCKNSDLLVLYGDTIIDKADLEKLYQEFEPAALLYPITDSSKNWIGAAMEDSKVSLIGAHYRGDTITHQFAGFALNKSNMDYIKNTPDYFPDVKVGVGTPRERFIEAGLLKMIEKEPLKAIVGQGMFFDIDKPWHMLMANEYMVHHRTEQLTENILTEGSHISAKAMVKGFVQLGKNSFIGDNVLIKGSLIVGDNTIIDNGAIFNGSAVIGSNTDIRNYCLIYDGVSIGNNCILDHGAEFIGGMLMDKVYLYHYCEMYGAIGSYTDIGAATVCGTLRFDDGDTRQVVKGRREVPRFFGDAVYIGDYCRTGVNAILMPGCKIGAYSVIGPGVILNSDVEDNSLVQVKQDLVIKKWGPDKYGW